MKFKGILAGVAAAAALAGCGSALAGTTAYNNKAAFTAATSGLSLSFESFESAPGPGSTATSLNFGGVNFKCVGTTWCPGFFGQSTLYATDGIESVFFATPDTGVFTFSSPINAFGIDVIGMGDVGTTTFSIDDGTGPMALETNYNAPSGTVTFAGITDSSGFTTVSFTGTQPNDGVFFDSLHFGAGTVGGVPEPAAWAMMLMGLGCLGAVMRTRRRAEAGLVTVAD